MLAEADMGMTQMAMTGENQHAGDEQLGVVFYVHPKKNETKSLEAGRPIYEDREYIRIVQPGNKENIIERPASDMDKQRFPRHYQAFKQRINEDEMIEGTRLEEWPAITRSQVAELKYLNVQTVEQLAGMSDSNAQGMMGVNMLKQKAKAYLEAAETSKAAEEMLQLRSTNELLLQQMEEMKAEFAALKESAEPKRRTRAKKSAETAEEG